MAHSTYGVADLSVTIAHPSLGQLSLNGYGFDTITFTLAEDSFVQVYPRPPVPGRLWRFWQGQKVRAADGSVMTSKQEAKHGTVAITVQQTSEAHIWLTRAYNYVKSAPIREGAKFELEATASDMRVTHIGSYMAIQKRADKPYQAQGQKVTWTFLASELSEL